MLLRGRQQARETPQEAHPAWGRFPARDGSESTAACGAGASKCALGFRGSPSPGGRGASDSDAVLQHDAEKEPEGMPWPSGILVGPRPHRDGDWQASPPLGGRRHRLVGSGVTGHRGVTAHHRLHARHCPQGVRVAAT
jgi:hypothetical protein